MHFFFSVSTSEAITECYTFFFNSLSNDLISGMFYGKTVAKLV